jgi:hypothetical protein
MARLRDWASSPPARPTRRSGTTRSGRGSSPSPLPAICRDGYCRTPIAIFLSEALGRPIVETAYPRGATIDVPQLLAGPVGSSPADALATQRERLASLGGAGRSVVTMADYLAVEATQRASNGGMRIREHLDRVVEPAIRDFAISLVIDTIALGALLVGAPAG